MARNDPIDKTLLIADLTQSWSDVGGGVRTYLRHKRSHILDHTPHRHLMIVPGKRDAVEVEKGGRAITAYVASPKVPGSPHYRLLLRNRAVRSLLSEYLPDLIECQDAYNLPWVVIGHALSLVGNPPQEAVLAVGDALVTDMLGAARQGYDAVFVQGGIHAGEEFPAGFAVEYGLGPWTPVAVVESLA